jgi:hypothetical protein
VKVGAFPQRDGGNINNSKTPRRSFFIEHLTSKEREKQISQMKTNDFLEL